MLQERLRLIERAVAAAEMDRSKAGRWLDAKIAREMLMHEDNLAMVLAPFLHGNRCPSSLAGPIPLPVNKHAWPLYLSCLLYLYQESIAQEGAPG